MLDVVRHVQALLTDLPRYVELLQTVGDPEAAEAQVLAIRTASEAAIAQANERALAERTRAQKAETVLSAGRLRAGE